MSNIATEKTENIIVLALPRWDGRYSSTSLSLAQELSRHHNVFYIDNPFTLKDVITKFNSKQIKSRLKSLFLGLNKFKRADNFPNLIYVTPRAVLPINFLPASKIYNFLSAINDRIVFSSIKSLLKNYKIESFIFINSYNPFYSIYFPKNFRPRLRIYHCVDDISESRYVARHGVRLEKAIMAASDFTLATSSQLVKLKSQWARKTFYLPNAANFEHFQKYLERGIFENLENVDGQKKVIGYIGNICHRIDYELLSSTIKGHKDKTFLFVGPVSAPEAKTSGIMDMPNTVFTGSKNMDDLPKYLYHMDCTIIPFKQNKLTQSIYPLKINEYLSMGKPVVSTLFSEDIKQFEDYISLENDGVGFSQSIEKELQNDSEDKQSVRMAIASKNTWKSRAEQFWQIITEYSAKSPRL